ncbi:flagellar hook-length control protein FliK [Bradyrhizobium sp.]|uniref:flagellar hook-length control protein FliK n=1 Tax=Bradyrhizobium sp. TaxID=376 RepID=UPI003C7198D8
MFSVTSEAAANAAFQAAPQWSVRPDQAPANDLFGALVNHNTAADNATAPSPPPPQRRADDAPPPANNAGPANGASNQAASNDPNSNTNAGPPSDVNANNANTSGPTSTGATQPSQTKSTGATKADPAKPTDKSASGDTSAVDLTILAQQAALTATTPNPVAVAIPVTTASTNVPAATTSGNSTAPLAIAAAAIAASTQAVSAQAASSAQIKTDPNAAVTDAAAAAATTTATAASAGTATAKVAISAAAGGTVAAPVVQQATQAIATPANAAALTSAVAATVPVTPKAAPGKSSAAPAATDGSTTTSGTADPSAANAPAGAAQNGLLQQPSTAGKPENTNAAVEAAAADAAASSTSAITAHEHSPAASTGHTLTDTPDPSTQPTGTFQPQPNTPAGAAAPGGAFGVTAATNGPVPLSGLALEIAASAKSGKSRFEIRLDPADLGRIDVRIDIDRNGQVTSHLTVEKPETLSMLRQDAPQLQRALDDAGLKTGSGGLQFSLRDQSSSGQNNGNDASPNAQRLVISEEDTIPASVAGRSYGRALGPSSGVDIRV